jgi:hypothetical protein
MGATATAFRRRAQVQLLPPQFTYFNFIKYSVGNDPLVTVEPLNQLGAGKFLITLRVRGLRKARALAALLLPRKVIGSIQLTVQVRTMEGRLVKPLRCAFTPSGIVKLCQTAFRTNALFRFAASRRFFGLVVVYPVFKARIIQFFNDDLSDYYGNYNNIAAFVFREVMRPTIGRTPVSASTVRLGRS